MNNKERARLIAEACGEDGWQLIYAYQNRMDTQQWEELCDEFAQSLAEKN